MKEEIEKMYVQALIDDLPPNVFADQVLRLFSVVGQSEQLVAFLEFVEGYKMLEVDLEYEEIVRRFLGN
jgi:hypothetical protein